VSGTPQADLASTAAPPLHHAARTTAAGDPGTRDHSAISIAHLVGRWGFGGLEGQLSQIVNRLPAHRFRHVIVFRNGSNDSGPPLRPGIETICVDDPPRDRRWALRLAKLLRSLQVTVVHNCELTTVCDTVAACRLAGISQMAFSFHGFSEAAVELPPMTRWRWRRALKRYRARWAVSEAAQQAIIRTLRLRPRLISVVNNGVDTTRFCPLDRSRTLPSAMGGDHSAGGTSSLPPNLLIGRTGSRPAEPSAGPVDTVFSLLRRRLGLPLTRPVLLAVGNLTPVKNHQLILEAIWTGNLRPEQYTLVLLGEDRLNGQTQRWAAHHLPDHDIRFVGLKTDVLPWYQTADVFLLPSRSEGLCNALLEAMACGVPTVATDVPGNREVLTDGETGLLCPAGDPTAFGTALRRLTGDADLRARLGRAARACAAQTYDISRTVEAHSRIYEMLGAAR
jgi:glycosyltransferase involved in cell wall biosynthesis